MPSKRDCGRCSWQRVDLEALGLERRGAGGVQLEHQRLAEGVLELDFQGVEAAIGGNGAGDEVSREAGDGLARGANNELGRRSAVAALRR